MFTDKYNRIRKCLPIELNDIIAELFSGRVLSQEVRDVLIQSQPSEKRDKLLHELQRSIEEDYIKFNTFLWLIEKNLWRKL